MRQINFSVLKFIGIYIFIIIFSKSASGNVLNEKPIIIDPDFCKERMSDEKFKKLIQKSRNCTKDSDCTSFSQEMLLLLSVVKAWQLEMIKLIKSLRYFTKMSVITLVDAS